MAWLYSYSWLYCGQLGDSLSHSNHRREGWSILDDAVTVAIEEMNQLRQNWRDTQRAAEQRFNFSILLISGALTASGLVAHNSSFSGRDELAMHFWLWLAVSGINLAVFYRLLSARRSIFIYLRDINVLRTFVVDRLADDGYKLASPSFRAPTGGRTNLTSLAGICMLVVAMSSGVLMALSLAHFGTRARLFVPSAVVCAILVGLLLWSESRRRTV